MGKKDNAAQRVSVCNEVQAFTKAAVESGLCQDGGQWWTRTDKGQLMLSMMVQSLEVLICVVPTAVTHVTGLEQGPGFC